MNKYKIGDHVVIEESNIERTKKFAGETGVIKDILPDRKGYDYLVKTDNGSLCIWCKVKCFVGESNIKRVIFNDPATIIMWADGTKTVAKAVKGDKYDPEKGFAIAYAKKFAGKTFREGDVLSLDGSTGNIYDTLIKTVPADPNSGYFGRIMELADKYDVREFIKKTIGEEYLVPIFGVYSSVDEIDFDSVPVKQANTIKEYLKSGLSPEQIKYNIQAKYNLMSLDSNMRQMTYDRVLQSENPKKVKRYNIGIIPGTNVKFIALYNMNDFNFSDALKHGKIRQNDRTEEIMGYKSTKRGDRLPVTYDNKNTIPDIKDNFSLNNVKPQHFKTQYDFADKNSYTSIHQFLDKSIIYAASVLKDENFIPDYIVSPPSSSKFNSYYSINLSRKLGCEYIENFFKKSTFQVKVNGGQDTEIMKTHGFTDKDIFIFENKVKMLAFKQITNEIRTTIYKFVTKICKKCSLFR